MSRARATRVLLPAIFLTGLMAWGNPAAGAEAPVAPIAVIVHEQVPVDQLSLTELRQVFLGERLFWTKDLTITLLVPSRGTSERKVLLDKIYQQRSEAQFRHHWINKLFSGDARSNPKISGSPRMSASLVREIPGAIALVPADRIPPGVKVLRIDGRAPGEAGYPLVPPG